MRARRWRGVGIVAHDACAFARAFIRGVCACVLTTRFFVSRRCIDKKFKDGDLNVGENSCVDRCSAKYWESVTIVGQMLGAAGQAPQ